MPEPTVPEHDSFIVVTVPFDTQYVVVQRDNYNGRPVVMFAHDHEGIQSIYAAFDAGYQLGRQS